VHKPTAPDMIRHEADVIRLALSVWRFNGVGQQIDADTQARLLDAVERLVWAAQGGDAASDSVAIPDFDYGYAAGKARGWFYPSELLGRLRKEISHSKRCPGVIEYSGMQCAVCGGA